MQLLVPPEDTPVFAGVSDRLFLQCALETITNQFSSEYQLCNLIASVTSSDMPHTAARALLDLASSRVKSTVSYGQVIVVSRRALRDTPDASILKEAVCHLPEGASILLVSESYWVSPPFRICTQVQRSEAEPACALFMALMNSQMLAPRDAWLAASALSS
jgi:hypothetical protein